MRFSRKIFVILMSCILMTDTFFPKHAACITIREEEELSREFMKMVLKSSMLINDPLPVNYVNEVGNRVLSVFPAQPFPFHFYIINEEVYNAFAAPAGHIFINSGLFEAMENEDELAGILAHEISHTVCRHISQKIERSSKISLITLAGLAASLFLGGGAVANALGIGSIAAGQSLSLAYSREDERQADQMGLKYLREAGYGSAGLLTMLKKIRNKQWYGSNEVPTYLMTHPAIEERIVYIEGQRSGDRGQGSGVRGQKFREAHTCLTALYGDQDAVFKQFESDVAKNPDDAVSNYGYGLILARTGNRSKAIVYLKKALGKNPFDAYILKDLGITYFYDGQYAEALKTLEGSVSIDPFDPEGLLFMGRTQLELKQFESAESTLKSLLEKHQDYRQAFYFLGEACGRQEKADLSHYWLGMYYEYRGDLRNALFHLERSLKLTTNPDKKAEIEERLKELKAEKLKIERSEDKPGAQK